MTTIKDLYEWAIVDGVEDLPVGLKFQDEDSSWNFQDEEDEDVFVLVQDED